MINFEKYRRDDNSIDLRQAYCGTYSVITKGAENYLLDVEMRFRIASRQAAAIATATAHQFRSTSGE